MNPSLSEVGTLVRVALKHPRDAFIDDKTIAAQWRALRFSAPPDLPRAIDEFERFVAIIEETGARVDLLSADPQTTLDSIYVRDASLVCDRGVILCTMGKPARAGEPGAQADVFRRLGVAIIGAVQAPGHIEGGDVVWLGPRTVAVGQGYRTNADGIRQLRDLLGPSFEVLVVPLPHWHGDNDVMHLMSLISPLDLDLALVYPRLLPVPFYQELLARDVRMIAVPDDEFESMGTNVLSLAPRRGLMLSGNRQTRVALERAGVEVIEYEGTEISRKGAGGPTCLTRPLARASTQDRTVDGRLEP